MEKLIKMELLKNYEISRFTNAENVGAYTWDLVHLCSTTHIHIVKIYFRSFEDNHRGEPGSWRRKKASGGGMKWFERFI